MIDDLFNIPQHDISLMFIVDASLTHHQRMKGDSNLLSDTRRSFTLVVQLTDAAPGDWGRPPVLPR